MLLFRNGNDAGTSEIFYGPLYNRMGQIWHGSPQPCVTISGVGRSGNGVRIEYTLAFQLYAHGKSSRMILYIIKQCIAARNYRGSQRVASRYCTRVSFELVDNREIVVASDKDTNGKLVCCIIGKVSKESGGHRDHINRSSITRHQVQMSCQH